MWLGGSGIGLGMGAATLTSGGVLRCGAKCECEMLRWLQRLRQCAPAD